MTKNNYNFQKDTLQDIVDKCSSTTEVLSACGMDQHNTYARAALYAFCKRNNILLPKRSYSQHRKSVNRKLIDLLVMDGPRITSSALKNRLISTKTLEEICVICYAGPYKNNKRLVLQLDHIDGYNGNNQIENLRILCPDCHTQTDSYSCGPMRDGEGNLHYCTRCNEPCYFENTMCKACQSYLIYTGESTEKELGLSHRHRSRSRERLYINWESDEKICELLKVNSIKKVATELGVSFISLQRKIKENDKFQEIIDRKKPDHAWPDDTAMVALILEKGKDATAVHLNIPRATFYKYLRDNNLNEKIPEQKLHKITWPELTELEALIGSHNGNLEAVSRELGISSNAIRKHLRTAGVDMEKYRKQAPRKIINWPSTEELIQRVNNSTLSAVAREIGVDRASLRKRINNESVDVSVMS